MLAPLSWLRDYAPLSGALDGLVTTLSELGLVVEGVQRVGGELGGVVVARVDAIRAHPRADRVRLVDVDPGGGESLQIVCGAWNFREGDLVPLALPGAVLAGGMEISRRSVRGERSNGMLCSAAELGLPARGAEEDGLMVLPAGVAPTGTPLAEALGLPPDEVVLDLDVSPNRPDALCMAGVARDLAAALGEPWELPASGSVPSADEGVGLPELRVEAGDLCPRFTATILEDVPTGATPAWIARRLTLAGMRPINPVVDISNYVMLDLGQPNHAYDLDKLAGGGILVRRADAGEKLVTLDGVERVLGPDDCLICDALGGAVGIGGIMGGESSEIGAGTRRVLLEAAWFSPSAVARTGKRLALGSEARLRFERGVDPQVAPLAVERFLSLLGQVEGGAGLRRGPSVDVQDAVAMPPPLRVTLRTSRVNSVLGTAIPHQEIAGLIAPIGFRSSASGPDAYEVTVPSWRLECSREIDVIEEIARMWGYRRIERTIPRGARTRAAALTESQRERRRVRHVLTGAGFDEAWTTTFLAPGDLERAALDPAAVEVENPLDRSESVLRTSLLPGLLKALRSNLDRQAGDVCLFEIGRVFRLPAEGCTLPDEEELLGVVIAPSDAACGDDAAASAVETWIWLTESLRLAGATVAAGDVPGLHPGRRARLLGASGSPLGVVGEVDPGVGIAYGMASRVGFLELSLDRVAREERREPRAREVSRYPASEIDLAFVLSEAVPAGDLHATLVRAGGEVVEAVTLFDVYRGPQVGEGRRSLAFHLRYRAANRTLSEDEVASLRRGAISAAEGRHGAELRS